MRATEHAPRCPFQLLERRHGLAEIVERGGWVIVATALRCGDSARNILIVQGNVAFTYRELGRHELALSMRQKIYSGCLKLHGERDPNTLREAINYAESFVDMQRYADAKLLLRKMMPVARRVLGNSHDFTLTMRMTYEVALYEDPDATLEDIREAVTTLEELKQTARRVFGGEHPTTTEIETTLQKARALLRAREAGKKVVFAQEYKG